MAGFDDDELMDFPAVGEDPEDAELYTAVEAAVFAESTDQASHGPIFLSEVSRLGRLVGGG